MQELDDLISSIKLAYGLTEEEISLAVKRNKGYLAQVRSRKEVSEKFVESLKLKFPPIAKANNAAYLEAAISVLMQRVSSLMAGMTGRSEIVELELIKKDAQDLLKIGGGA